MKNEGILGQNLQQKKQLVSRATTMEEQAVAKFPPILKDLDSLNAEYVKGKGAKSEETVLFQLSLKAEKALLEIVQENDLGKKAELIQKHKESFVKLHKLLFEGKMPFSTAQKGLHDRLKVIINRVINKHSSAYADFKFYTEMRKAQLEHGEFFDSSVIPKDQTPKKEPPRITIREISVGGENQGLGKSNTTEATNGSSNKSFLAQELGLDKEQVTNEDLDNGILDKYLAGKLGKGTQPESNKEVYEKTVGQKLADAPKPVKKTES